MKSNYNYVCFICITKLNSATVVEVCIPMSGVVLSPHSELCITEGQVSTLSLICQTGVFLPSNE